MILFSSIIAIKTWKKIFYSEIEMDLFCVFFIVILHFVLRFCASNYVVFKKYRPLANKKVFFERRNPK